MVRDEQKTVLNDVDATKDYCMSPSKYEFCDGEACSWAAKDMACMELCTFESNMNTCNKKDSHSHSYSHSYMQP